MLDQSDPQDNTKNINDPEASIQDYLTQDEKDFFSSIDCDNQYDDQWEKEDNLVDPSNTIPYDWSDDEFNDDSDIETVNNHKPDKKNKDDDNKTKLSFCLDMFFHKLKLEIKVNHLDKKLMQVINNRSEYDSLADLSEKKDKAPMSVLDSDANELLLNL
jgi:hypothetical protein